MMRPHFCSVGNFRDPQYWDPHTIPMCLGILIGILWEAYHQGIPLLGVPGMTLDLLLIDFDLYSESPIMHVSLLS